MKLFLMVEASARMWAWGTVVSLVVCAGQRRLDSCVDLLMPAIISADFNFQINHFEANPKAEIPLVCVL